MKERGHIVNWQDVHVSLERTQKAIQTGDEPPQEEVARILKGRALALAAPPEDTTPAAKMIQLLVVTLSGERFGIEAAPVIEVIPIQGLISVPCTPTFVVGVVNCRGRILTVLDFRKLFELPGQGVTEKGHVVVVKAEGMVCGVFINAVEGIIQVPAHEVTPSPATFSDDCGSFILGMTGDMIPILDLSTLVQDPRFMVNEEVNQRNS